jgi:hypothetical protein
LAKKEYYFKSLGKAIRDWIQMNRKESKDYLEEQEILDISIK